MLILEFFLGLLIGTAIGVSANKNTELHPIILLGALAIIYILAEATVNVLFTTDFTL